MPFPKIRTSLILTCDDLVANLLCRQFQLVTIYNRFVAFFARLLWPVPIAIVPPPVAQLDAKDFKNKKTVDNQDSLIVQLPVAQFNFSVISSVHFNLRRSVSRFYFSCFVTQCVTIFAILCFTTQYVTIQIRDSLRPFFIQPFQMPRT